MIHLHRNSLGPSLRRIRKATGLTQHQIGEQIGMTHAGVSKIEVGDRETTTNMLFRWTEACGALVYLEEEGAPPPVPWPESMSPADRALFCAILRRWSSMDEVQREMFRVQFEVLGRVSDSECKENVKTPPARVGS